MKFLLGTLFAAMICCSQISAQEGGWCGTVLPKKKGKVKQATLFNHVNTLKHDTCLNKKFSIVFHVIADPAGSWNMNPSQLDTAVAMLNRTFAPICVSFAKCSVVVIPNHVYNDWAMPHTEKLVVPNWYTEETINVYLPAVITGMASGYANSPGGLDFIVVEKLWIGTTVILHEMGHFFGLPHTFDEIGTPVSPGPPGGVTSYEFVNRTNCYQQGDGFCDTEADCFPLPNGTKDGNGVYYVRPVDNLMSYYNYSPCRFTREQYNFMASTILTQRLYLH